MQYAPFFLFIDGKVENTWVMVMRILFEGLLGISKSGLYILFMGLFMGWTKDSCYDKKVCFGGSSMAIILSVFNYYDADWMIAIEPFIVLLLLSILGIMAEEKKNVLLSIARAIESYVAFFLLSLIYIVMFGVLSPIVFNSISRYGKYTLLIVIRTFCLIMIGIKYEWLQKQVEKTAVNVMILIGALLMFFKQFFQMAYVDKNYSFAMIVVLLLYLTMIFTAFMLLQHNRLTAKQQAIEEDNRQMSQRLHRSKDVLGVVSQVVASEEHIDPKLRKELADFCDDEMNEMQDRTLGVNLIGDTGIELVNVMLQKQMLRCADLNISFDVMIPAPIDGYIQNIGISVTEFMRMLNDLLKNAVKAILSSENEHRELLLIMGDAGADCFEIRLYDSGVPFPPVILEHMGERGNTTDGTGNGLADTIETLDHYHASFAIESIEPGTDIYTKCVHIAFDGRGCGA